MNASSVEKLPMIRSLEELSINAWPALESILYDGWLLRFSNGYTRRANSVNALYTSSLPVDEKITVCEAFYGQRERDVVFKLTEAAEPADLDDALERRGYRKTAATSVQTLALKNFNRDAQGEGVSIATQLTDDWLVNFRRLSGTEERHAPTMSRMLASIVPRCAFVLIRRDDHVMAAGMAVLERGTLGLYDIVVDANSRGQGMGTQLLLNLLAWGTANGASQAYLQVMCDNLPALWLYERMGFKEAYLYWYRVQSTWG